MITYHAEGVKMPHLKKRILNQWIRQVAARHGRKVGDIGYMFVNDDRILEVNNTYLGHDYYTDIITFDYDEADLFHKAYADELHRVSIHGILHLCGINDKGPGERDVMEAHENEALALLAKLLPA